MINPMSISSNWLTLSYDEKCSVLTQCEDTVGLGFAMIFVEFNPATKRVCVGQPLHTHKTFTPCLIDAVKDHDFFSHVPAHIRVVTLIDLIRREVFTTSSIVAEAVEQDCISLKEKFTCTVYSSFDKTVLNAHIRESLETIKNSLTNP